MQPWQNHAALRELFLKDAILNGAWFASAQPALQMLTTLTIQSCNIEDIDTHPLQALEELRWALACLLERKAKHQVEKAPTS